MQRAAIVSPLRTPIGAFGGSLRSVPVEELGATVARAIVQRTGHELKLVFPQAAVDPDSFADLDFRHHWLQPMDGPDRLANTAEAVAYCRRDARWRLSLQTHKIIGIP